VRHLQDYLEQLGFSIEPNERDAGQYGTSTITAVSSFQTKHGLKPTGEVDEATAKAINTAIEQMETPVQPDPIPPPKPDPNTMALVVKGNVRGIDSAPISGITVYAFDADLPSLGKDQLLGQPAVTDGTGFYQITYTAEQFSSAETDSADLRVLAFTGD